MSAATLATICAAAVTLGDINVVQIGPRLRVDRADFEAGIINGQTFALGPNTVFNVVDRGVIGDMGAPETALEFNGATIVINEGGRLDTGALASVNIEVRPLGVIDRNVTLVNGSTVEINGGNVGPVLELISSSAMLNQGVIFGFPSDGIILREESELIVNGGSSFGAAVGNQGSLYVIGGEASFWRAEAGGLVDISGGFVQQPRPGSSPDATYNIRGGRFARSALNFFAFLRPNIFAHSIGQTPRSAWFALETGGAYIVPEVFESSFNVVGVVPPQRPSPLILDGNEGTALIDGLGPGDHLIIRGGADVGSLFSAVGATIELEDGVIGSDFVAIDTNLIITGGEVMGPASCEACNIIVTGGQLRSDSESQSTETLALTGAISVEIDGGEILGGLSLNDQFGLIDFPSELIIQSGKLELRERFSYVDRFFIHGGEVFGAANIAADQICMTGGRLSPTNTFRLNANYIRISGGELSPFAAVSGESVDVLVRDDVVSGEPLAINETLELPFTIIPGEVTLADGTRITPRAFAATTAYTRIDPTRCSEADLAAPTGTLDIADIVEFLSLYQAQSVLADLAEPYERFEIGDVVAFLQLFGDGCP